jgi:hypothetical protein
VERPIRESADRYPTNCPVLLSWSYIFSFILLPLASRTIHPADSLLVQKRAGKSKRMVDKKESSPAPELRPVGLDGFRDDMLPAWRSRLRRQFLKLVDMEQPALYWIQVDANRTQR